MQRDHTRLLAGRTPSLVTIHMAVWSVAPTHGYLISAHNDW